MGFLDLFNPQPTTPTVPSILTDSAKRQIISGQLPILKPNNIFLKSGEICHYVDRAIFEKKTVRKKSIRKNRGYSVPGLFKGTRVHVGGGETTSVDDVSYETIKGILCVTNKRVLFVSSQEGFDKKVSDLIAVTPYANCIELQFSKDIYKVFVPDGSIVFQVLKLIQ